MLLIVNYQRDHSSPNIYFSSFKLKKKDIFGGLFVYIKFQSWIQSQHLSRWNVFKIAITADNEKSQSHSNNGKRCTNKDSAGTGYIGLLFWVLQIDKREQWPSYESSINGQSISTSKEQKQSNIMDTITAAAQFQCFIIPNIIYHWYSAIE